MNNIVSNNGNKTITYFVNEFENNFEFLQTLPENESNKRW